MVPSLATPQVAPTSRCPTAAGRNERNSCSATQKPAADSAKAKNPTLARRAAFSRLFESPQDADSPELQLLFGKGPRVAGARDLLTSLRISCDVFLKVCRLRMIA